MSEKTMEAPGADFRRSAPKADPALVRALACAECSQRDAVIANIKSKAYARPEDLETDLRWLETL